MDLSLNQKTLEMAYRDVKLLDVESIVQSNKLQAHKDCPGRAHILKTKFRISK